MRRETRRRALLGLALAALIAGVAIAIVAASSGGGHSTPQSTASATPARPLSALSVAARYLGMSVTELRSKLVSGKTLAEVAAAAPDRSTKGLEEALVSAKAKRIEARAARDKVSSARTAARIRALRRRAARALRRQHGVLRSLSARLSVAAAYLGVPEQQLLADVRSGRSLAQIASSRPGRSTAGLIDALVAEKKKLIVSAAASGTISRQTEARLLARLRERAKTEVEAS